MQLPRFHVYIAASIDGYIADAGGGVGWLDGFPAEDYGHEFFASKIDTVVMGRTTYDQTLTLGPWPYAGKRGVVLSTRPVIGLVDGVEDWSGDLAELAKRLTQASAKNVWIVGGGKTVAAFMSAGMVDELEIYVIPVLLGDGVPLFPRAKSSHPMQLTDATTLARGVVRLRYALPV